MLVATETRLCLVCDKPLKGRTDKKFCDDYCRNGFNNHLKASTNNLIRNINNALKRNRKVLAELLPENEKGVRVNRFKLLQMGFQFQYLTHTYTNQQGKQYYFCYEYGYLPLDNACFLIVKGKNLDG